MQYIWICFISYDLCTLRHCVIFFFQTLKHLNYLDLHSNHFTSFPTYLLKIPCIAHLDVSRNDIGPSLILSSKFVSYTLKLLNLSYNQLLYVPEFLADVAEKLEHLILEG